MADIAKSTEIRAAIPADIDGLAAPIAWPFSASMSVVLLIAATMALRLAFAGWLGLTIDEQYMVAAGRRIQAGYFDHPPAAWWLSWAASRLAGGDAPIVVRTPFVLLFGVSTWLMYRLTALLFSERAGVWAAMLMNLAPIIGLAAASWVGPDGPLICALLAAALCLAHALFGRSASARAWWAGAGVCAGLALFSKYTAILTIAGAAGFLLTQPGQRRWLVRVEPYLAAGLAAVVFAPVVVWNAQHGWASFAFQAGRAAPAYGLRAWGPLEVLGGGALFLLPHLWLGLVVALVAAVRIGPGDERSWLAASLAIPTLALFVAVSFWNAQVMFHWASPGYLMAIPLLGAMIEAQRPASRDWARRALGWTAALVVLGAAAYTAETRWNAAPEALRRMAARVDPNVESGDWSSLKTTFAERGYLKTPNLVFAGADWRVAGKLDYALGGAGRVVGLGGDMREYRLLGQDRPPLGADVLIAAPGVDPMVAERRVRALFDRVEVLAPAPIVHAGRTVEWAPLLLGHRYRGGSASF